MQATKFGIDKRKAHLSSLIRNGELTRDAALAELSKPVYDPADLRKDKEYVLKKLGFTDQEFEQIMSAPVRSHADYPSLAPLLKVLNPMRKLYLRKTVGRG